MLNSLLNTIKAEAYSSNHQKMRNLPAAFILCVLTIAERGRGSNTVLVSGGLEPHPYQIGPMAYVKLTVDVKGTPSHFNSVYFG